MGIEKGGSAWQGPLRQGMSNYLLVVDELLQGVGITGEEEVLLVDVVVEVTVLLDVDLDALEACSSIVGGFLGAVVVGAAVGS